MEAGLDGERARNAQYINGLRLAGASSFAILAILATYVLRQPGWDSILGILLPYWVIAATLFFLPLQKRGKVMPVAWFAIAAVDIPLVFLLQWQSLPDSPSPGGVAGFTLGIFVLLVALAGLSMAAAPVIVAAVIATPLEIALQWRAELMSGAEMAAALVMVLVTATCLRSGRRLRDLVVRVQADFQELEAVQTRLVKEAVARGRAEEGMDIAQRVQALLLPTEPHLPGLEIAASMLPASQLGGDYYDVLETPEGGWIGIGDVSGHGVSAGLMMMLVQSAMASVARMQTSGSPSECLRVLNDVVYDVIHRRLGQTDHVTFTLLHYNRDGTLTFAGAHNYILVYRTTGQIERVPTPGTWLGAMADIKDVTVDGTLRLNDGDVVVLYTDGITDAANTDRQVFDVEGLCSAVADVRDLDARRIRDHVISAVQTWMVSQDDDMTILVMRYRAEGNSP